MKQTNKGDGDRDEMEKFAKFITNKSLNKSLQSIGKSLIKKKRLGEGRHPTSKI
jgi:hypothetical protein